MPKMIEISAAEYERLQDCIREDGLRIAALIEENKALHQDARRLTAVDAAPVVHSKWKLVGADKRGRGGTFVCLACDKCYPFTCDYCPNCGAKMGGEENAE